MDFIKEYQILSVNFDEIKEVEKTLLTEKSSFNGTYKKKISKSDANITKAKEKYQLTIENLDKKMDIDIQNFQSSAVGYVTEQIDELIEIKKNEKENLQQQLQEIDNIQEKIKDYIYINLLNQVTKSIIKDSYLSKLPVNKDEIIDNIFKYRNRSSFNDARERFLSMNFNEIDQKFNEGKYTKVAEKKDWLALFRNHNRKGINTEGFLTILPFYLIVSIICLVVRWLFSISIGALADNIFGRFSLFSGISNFLTIILNIIGFGPMILLIIYSLIFLGSKLLNFNIKKPFDSQIDKQLLNTNAVLYYIFASYDDYLIYKMSQEKTAKLPNLSITTEQLNELQANYPELSNDSVLQNASRSLVNGGSYESQLANFESSITTGKQDILETLTVIDNELEDLENDRDFAINGEFSSIKATVEIQSADKIAEAYEKKKQVEKDELNQELEQLKAKKISISNRLTQESKEIDEKLERVKEEKALIIQAVDELTKRLKMYEPGLTEIEMASDIILEVPNKHPKGEIYDWKIIHHNYSALLLVYSTPSREVKEGLFSFVISNLLDNLTLMNNFKLFRCIYIDEDGMGVNLSRNSQVINSAEKYGVYVNLTTYGQPTIKNYFDDLAKNRENIVENDIDKMNKESFDATVAYGLEDNFKPIRYEFPIIDLNRKFPYKDLAKILINRSKGLGVIPIYFVEQQEFTELKKDKNWLSIFEDAFKNQRVFSIDVDALSEDDKKLKLIQIEEE